MKHAIMCMIMERKFKRNETSIHRPASLLEALFMNPACGVISSTQYFNLFFVLRVFGEIGVQFLLASPVSQEEKLWKIMNSTLGHWALKIAWTAFAVY